MNTFNMVSKNFKGKPTGIVPVYPIPNPEFGIIMSNVNLDRRAIIETKLHKYYSNLYVLYFAFELY